MKKINPHKVYLLFVVIIFFVFAGLYGVRIYNDFFKEKEKVPTEPEIVEEKLSEIKEYGYTLSDRDTEVFKTHFETLNDILTKEEINYEEYAKELTALFVIDYYTLSNKKASTDIGGIEFLVDSFVPNFLINAQENMYKIIQSDFTGDRKQKLPTVKEVHITSIANKKITYKKKEYNGYKLAVKWSYVEDMGYESSSTFYVINIKNKLYVYSKSGSY